MIIKGGRRYPGSEFTALFLFLEGIALFVLRMRYNASGQEIVALAAGMTGTILMAGAFTPVGLLPPQGSTSRRVRWFFRAQGGTSVELSQPLLYLGLLLVLFSATFSVVIAHWKR